jgi:hypothetical protein
MKSEQQNDAPGPETQRLCGKMPVEQLRHFEHADPVPPAEQRAQRFVREDLPPVRRVLQLTRLDVAP